MRKPGNAYSNKYDGETERNLFGQLVHVVRPTDRQKERRTDGHTHTWTFVLKHFLECLSDIESKTK